VEGERVEWSIPTLAPGETETLRFKVRVGSGGEYINEFYGVTCYEGVTAVGVPVVTQISGGRAVYLPLVIR
jgi:hypothetical protein